MIGLRVLHYINMRTIPTCGATRPFHVATTNLSINCFASTCEIPPVGGWALLFAITGSSRPSILCARVHPTSSSTAISRSRTATVQIQRQLHQMKALVILEDTGAFHSGCRSITTCFARTESFPSGLRMNCVLMRAWVAGAWDSFAA
jgi:hypothetical protein